MGKKKASKARRLRPLLEQAIANDKIFCSPVKARYIDDDGKILECTSDYQSYDVLFGYDAEPGSSYWRGSTLIKADEQIHVHVDVYSNGDIKFYFVGNRNHVLDRPNAAWFVDQLEQIITLHKMGAYESQHSEDRGRHVDYSFFRKPGYYRSKRS